MKLIATIATAFLVVFGAGATASATAEDCAESDTVPPDVECPVDGDNYPLVLPETGTVPDTVPPVTTPTDVLPATGTDTTTQVLQVAGLVLVLGLGVLVIARRRTPAQS